MKHNANHNISKGKMLFIKSPIFKDGQHVAKLKF